MYLSEEKRAEIRECIENQRSNIEFNSGEKKENHIKGFHDKEGVGSGGCQASCRLFLN